MTSGDRKNRPRAGPHQLRRSGVSLYLRRSFAKSMGYSSELLGRPVVGIADSRSGFNNCHRHFPELIEAVKRGVLAAARCRSSSPPRRSARCSSIRRR